MPRGGKRQGRPGVAYSNRGPDLNPHAPLPVTTAPDQGYGVAGQQAAAQRAIPLAPQPVPAGPAPTLASGANATGNMLRPAGQPLIALDAPTMRPDEPVTTAASAPLSSDNVAGLIGALAQQSTSPELAALAAYVNAGHG